jgi:hypothetical protein
MKQRARVTTAVLGTSLMLMGNTAQAEDAAEVFPEPKDCVSLTNLDRTDIIDDRNILFYMRGTEIYLNQLPHRCSGLRMADGFSYRRTINRLCHVDLIRPIPLGGMRGGISCGLGTFRLITEDEILVLKEKKPPASDMQGEGSEIESIDDDEMDEAAEIESIE